MRLAAIQRCRPLVGAELAGTSRDRADRYPDELVGAMVRQALTPDAARQAVMPIIARMFRRCPWLYPGCGLAPILSGHYAGGAAPSLPRAIPGSEPSQDLHVSP